MQEIDWNQLFCIMNTFLTNCSNSIMPQPYMHLSTLFIIVFFFKYEIHTSFDIKQNKYLFTLFAVFSIGAP